MARLEDGQIIWNCILYYIFFLWRNKYSDKKTILKMVYVECKIWPFSDEIIHQEARWKAMEKGHRHYTVKALIDITFSENFISKSLADRLGKNYTKLYIKAPLVKYKGESAKKKENSLGTIYCLDLSF